MSEPLLLTCVECGKAFFTKGEKKYYETHRLMLPKRCKACREARNAVFKKKKEEKENKEIDSSLSSLPYKITDISEIKINAPEKTLYIIGNGFDQMHGVPSSYYKFRDSLGKHSELRTQLERWNLKEDLWGDFEDSLAHMDDGGMLGSVPDMMDIMGVLDEDDDAFSAADFFAAAELSVYPLQVIENELPARFRNWINRLQPAGSEKPLAGLMNAEGRYINFNYTEFAETIYGVKKQNILYIHGDRRNKNQELILGHAPGAEYNPAYDRKHRTPGIYNQTSYDMYETASKYVGDYYDMTTKKSNDIIKMHRDYFRRLSDIENVVVIGHSLSYVDYPYFKEILRTVRRGKWNIGWHSLSDLRRIKDFGNMTGIDPKQIQLFRT